MDPKSLETLIQRWGFVEYRPSFIRRRVESRLRRLKMAFGDYLDKLCEDPNEVQALKDKMAVGTTGLFRNPSFWETLYHYLPENTPLQALSAPCATGEEAATLGVLLAEKNALDRVHGLDIHPPFLKKAKAGIYKNGSIQEVDNIFWQRYLKPYDESHMILEKKILGSISFRAANLFYDDVPTVNVAVVRNFGIYLKAEAFSNVLKKVLHSLVPGGLLFMGAVEQIPPVLKDQVIPLDVQRRIYKKGKR